MVNSCCVSSNRHDERETESEAVVQPAKFFGKTGEDIEKWLKRFV